MKDAILWDDNEDGSVTCRLCHHGCRLVHGKTGICGVRRCLDGRLYSLNYDRTVAANVDPIEKKPLFHYKPGSLSFSVASMGCNFSCRFCQNHSISQPPRTGGAIAGDFLDPGLVVQTAAARGCASIAHTYTEPTVYFEHAMETARLAADAGIDTVFVTNGFMSPEAASMMVPLVRALNIDLKSFRDETYRKVIGGRLQPVLDNIAFFHGRGVLVEVTTLVVTGMNDSDDELRDIARFIASVSPRIPWHVSRFHPAYRMTDRPATPLSSIRRAREIGLEEGLQYVYTGNVPGDGGESTICRDCGTLLVERRGFSVLANRLDGRRCPQCSAEHNFRV